VHNAEDQVFAASDKQQSYAIDTVDFLCGFFLVRLDAPDLTNALNAKERITDKTKDMLNLLQNQARKRVENS